MNNERVKEDDQKTKNQPRKKIMGQETAQSRLWEFMVNGRSGKPDDGFRPSTIFGCAEKE